MKSIRITALAASLALSAAIGPQAAAQKAGMADSLHQGFLNPPKEARPRVWWHWMNGNITKDGIRKDLLWMDRAGIVGFHNFDAGLQTPQIVDHRITYMSPEWKDCFSYALDLADSLDMEVTIAASPGWSETGGPWVREEDAMKKLVWRQIDVVGPLRPLRPLRQAQGPGKQAQGPGKQAQGPGKQAQGPGEKGPMRIELPEGFDVTGKFQDLPLEGGGNEAKFKDLRFYKDIAVLAVKLSDEDKDLKAMNPSVITSGIDEASFARKVSNEYLLERLNSDSVSDHITIKPQNGWSWIEYSFDEPQTVRSLIITERKVSGAANSLVREFQCSDDGINYRTVAVLEYQATAQKTYSFAPVTARRFRVRFHDTQEGGDRPFGVSQFILSTVNRVQLAGDKAGNVFYRLLQQESTPETDIAARSGDVIDLTDRFKDGVLTWDVPEGRWRIFRFGYSLTGKTNHPASPEATGLEVDKLDPAAVRSYLEEYLKTYSDASGGRLGGRGIQYLLTDSYEAGPQTWTGRMFEEFKARKGYDLLKWLPALTGMILDNTAETERFLFDWRRTIGEMMVEYHYDLQNEVLQPYGMKRYTESHEAWRSNLTDGMDCKRYAQVPMSAFWMQYNAGLTFNTRFEADIRESTSVAHIYGQNVAAAESFTANGFRDGAWVYSPSVLKPTADAAMASGLNRFVIHTSVHQPVDDKVPGLGLGPYGQWFNRHQTWADEARSWTNYLSRSCFMLQQGRFVADIAYYYGEDHNVTGLFMFSSPDLPEGYNYDFFSPSVLLDLAAAEDGDIVVPSGMRYRVLVLDPNVKYMSLPVLRKLKALADAGVNICGSRPEVMSGRNVGLLEFDECSSASLRFAPYPGEWSPEEHSSTSDRNEPEEEFKALVRDIWESGRENVSAGVPVGEVLRRIGVEPDFSHGGPADPDIRFVHRALRPLRQAQGPGRLVSSVEPPALRQAQGPEIEGPEGEIYWVANLSREAKTVEASFRVAGKKPVLWRAEDGSESPVSYYVNDGRTNVKLDLEGATSVFLLFMEDSEEAGYTAPAETIISSVDLDGPWKVSFQEGRGAPAEAISEKLASYTNCQDEGIRYFSGAAVYSKTFKVRKKDLGGRIILDLGDVRDLARVSVNGIDLGTVWHSPFRVDITRALNKGTNTLEIKVDNVWHNRIVGDMQPSAKEKVTYTPVDFFTADEPLLPAGLLGPVRLLRLSDDR